jgi:hypothetical protein
MTWGVEVILHIFEVFILYEAGDQLHASETPVFIGQEAGWAAEAVWMLWPRETSPLLLENEFQRSESEQLIGITSLKLPPT